jgi:hypothetical protein
MSQQHNSEARALHLADTWLGLADDQGSLGITMMAVELLIVGVMERMPADETREAWRRYLLDQLSLDD